MVELLEAEAIDLVITGEDLIFFRPGEACVLQKNKNIKYFSFCFNFSSNFLSLIKGIRSNVKNLFKLILRLGQEIFKQNKNLAVVKKTYFKKVYLLIFSKNGHTQCSYLAFLAATAAEAEVPVATGTLTEK